MILKYIIKKEDVENKSNLKDYLKNKLYMSKRLILQLKLNKTYGLRLYICTNEPEICDFMSNDLRGKGNIHLCDQCDGIMIVKRHKDMNKYFYGCTNYKNDKSGCNNIEEIEKY